MDTALSTASIEQLRPFERQLGVDTNSALPGEGISRGVDQNSRIAVTAMRPPKQTSTSAPATRWREW